MAAVKTSTGSAQAEAKRRGTWAAVAVHVLFIAGVGLSTTFVNVYLWRLGGGLGGGLGVVLHYHVALFLALIPGGALGGAIIGRRDRVAALRLGVAAHGVFFLAVLLLGWRSAAFAWPLGALIGLGMGFYYVALSVMVLDLAPTSGAGPLVGAMDQARLAAMTVTPFLAAFAIDRLPPGRGYPAVFAASLALFVTAAAFGQRLVARRHDGRALQLTATLLRPTGRWRTFLVAQGLRGVRDGVFLFLAGILVFERTRSELELGIFALGSGAVSWVLTHYVAQHVEVRRDRLRLLALGVVLSLLSALALALLPGLWGVVPFGVLEALAVPLVAVPFSSESYALVREDTAAHGRGVGYMVAREIPLNFGRLLGVALLLVVVEVVRRPQFLGLVLIAVTLANAGGWLVLRRLAGAGEAGGTTRNTTRAAAPLALARRRDAAPRPTLTAPPRGLPPRRRRGPRSRRLGAPATRLPRR